jgi:hypothetical protein
LLHLIRTLRDAALTCGLCAALTAGSALVLGSSTAGATGVGTTTTLNASPSGPSVSGQPVTFTATVAPVPPGTGVPTGNVSFTFTSRVSCNGGNTQPLTAGAATCTVSGLNASNSPITISAKYLGDGTFASSTGSLSQTVTQGNVSVTVTPSIPHAIGSGKPINFTASVVPIAPATGTPTGAITWSVVGLDASQVSCSNGIAVRLTRLDTAKCVVPSGQLVAADAPWTITAFYSGDGNFTPASQGYTQDVHATVTATHISSSPSPPSVLETLDITSSVSVPRFAVPPTGTLTFSFSTPTGSPIPGIVCGGGSNTIVLTTNFATCALPAGVEPHGTKYRVQSTYAGDANNAGSSSNFRSLLVH